MRDPGNVGRRGRPWQRAKRAAFLRWGTDCWICGHPGGYEGDHVVRLVDGGDPYDPENIRPAHGSNYPCPVCPRRRGVGGRCCNQERNRRDAVQRDGVAVMSIDPSSL